MRFLGLLSVPLVLAGDAPTPTASGNITITHAAVLDVVAGVVQRDQTVVVSNGIIVSVSPARATPRGTTVIDAHGRLLAPGFIDAHFHMCSIYRPACTNPRD